MSDMKRLLSTTMQYVNTSDISGQLLGKFSKGGEKIQDSTRTAIVVDKYHYQRAGQATDKRRRQSSIKTIENEDTQKSSSYFHDFSN